jgi:hypothetical protein
MKKPLLAILMSIIPMVLLIFGCSLVSINTTSMKKPTLTRAAILIEPTLLPLGSSPASAINCVDPKLELKGWWRGEGDATDSIGNHHGMFVNNAVFAPGKVGRAFSFNGIDNLVAVPDSNDWTLGNNDFSLDMWVNFNHIQSRTAFVGHDEGGGSTNKWIFWYDELGDDNNPLPALRFHINPSSDIRDPIFAKWTPIVGQWYHLAITRNDSLYALYIDGNQVATSVNTSEVANAAAPLTIGASEGFFFNGLIDEIHFFSRGLSSNEIRMIFNTGSEGICALNTTVE